MSKYPTIANLDHVIAQTVQFATNDYDSDNVLPENVAFNIAFTVSCFLAQHTVHGHNGVTTDEALDGLQVTTIHMPYEYRLALAQRMIEEYGGAK